MKGKTIGLGKVWGSILFIGMFSAFLLAPGSLFGADRIVLKATTAFPKNMRFNMHVPKLIELIEKDSGGRIKVVWLGGPEVVKTFDQANALKRGVVDMLLYTPFAYFKSLMPVSLAKGLSECTPWEERKNGAYELWSKMFEEKVNAKYLGCMHANLAFHIFSKKKIEKMADFKGFVCRVMPLYVPFMKSIGASPVTMPPTEVYTALQRGVVEGFMWPVFISDWGWQEVVKYVIFPGVFQIEAATVMNIKKWNSIPEDLQDVIVKAMEKVERIATKEFVEEAQKEWAKQEKEGVERITFSPDEAKKLHDIAYSETWKEVSKVAPGTSEKFKALTCPCAK